MQIKQLTTGFWVLIFLCSITGCSSLKSKTRNQEWLDLFGSSQARQETAEYDRARVESDYHTLMALSREVDSLATEMAELKRTMVFRESDYISEKLNRRTEQLLFRFTSVRDSLWDMVDFYRCGSSSDPEVHIRGSIIGMYAGLKLASASSYLAALFLDQDDVVDLFNTAHPSYDIPAGTYDKITSSITSVEHLELIDIAWYLFCRDLMDQKSQISIVKGTDPIYGELIAQMDELHAAVHIQTEYVLRARHGHFAELANRLNHSRIASLADDVQASLGAGVTQTRGFVFRNVSRIKKPTAHTLTFSSDQSRQIKDMLQPGDVLLTYTAGYMSNVFLPGEFKHGITYIGTVEQRRKAGLSDEVLKKRAISQVQAESLLKHVVAEKTADGYDVDIIEAVAEGVILNSLDKLLATHINRLVVIRPVISEKERLNQLVSLMQYLEAPYDFKFDFQNDAYQCCTELIYRTVNRKGVIDFPLVSFRGMRILAADDILRYYLDKNPAAFDFVLLVDQSPDEQKHTPVIFDGSEGLKSLYELMEIKLPQEYQ